LLVRRRELRQSLLGRWELGRSTLRRGLRSEAGGLRVRPMIEVNVVPRLAWPRRWAVLDVRRLRGHLHRRSHWLRAARRRRWLLWAGLGRVLLRGSRLVLRLLRVLLSRRLLRKRRALLRLR
jgi:hypothetical protein